MKRAALLGFGVVVASSVLVAPACVPTPPYAPWKCQPGYATCGGGENGAGYGNDPGCETNVANDAQNCGSCGNTCPQGALCTNGACTAPPTVITTDAAPNQLGIDSQNLYYWSNGSGTAEGIPKTGGRPFSISLPGNPVRGGNGGQVPFAVDDTGVYYPASTPNPSGPNSTTIDRVSPDGSSTQATTIATFAGTEQGAVGNVSGMTLFESTIVVFSMNGPGFETWSVAEAGGTPVQGAQVPSQNGSAPSFSGLASIAVDAANVYFVSNTATSNGSCQIGVLPLAGGTASSLPANAANGGCPSTLATDGTNLYWSISASMNENCGNSGNCRSQCVIDVYSEPVAGGTPTVLAQLPENAAPVVMAVDGSNLYEVTGESLWRIPIAGGTPTQLAANLNVGVSSICNGGGGGGGGNPNQTASIAIDATNVYLALPSGLVAVQK